MSALSQDFLAESLLEMARMKYLRVQSLPIVLQVQQADLQDLYLQISLGIQNSSGDANKNFVLSQQRAEAVKTYLIAKNISAHLLNTEGLGASQPVADNTTAEGRKKNRRIEFEVL